MDIVKFATGFSQSLMVGKHLMIYQLPSGNDYRQDWSVHEYRATLSQDSLSSFIHPSIWSFVQLSANIN